ncbi:olfactomedin-like protein 2B isoform X1 [Nomascus leucogenys]|uniref:olfactomedin-like protein 2B isoform X1 n=1 Tax=Nomascus leucogenys TaxID=61853 RepID=UPI00122DC21D|nr:olfactomedin-like protein 2B isoform X1 [Nomascus leucogenys]
MAKPRLLVLYFVLIVVPAWVSSIVPTGTSEPPDAQRVAPTEDETLQNEADNQENVLSQLLGDYDKVKAMSEGSDCQCKCVVRPLGRDACQRINAGASRKEDFYTVETITSGSSCKCACVAPPSALNPCEGDFRLQKLREADSQDLKLSTIIDMLEGAFYGLDLLKLHSVTTKLVGRVDKLEEEVSKNLTKENEQIKEDMEEIRTEMNKRGKENCSENILDSMPDIRSALQRDAAAAYAHPEEQYEERFLQEETVSQQINSIKLLQTRPLAPPEVVKSQRPLQRQVHLRGRPASQPTVIRGITYYKAKVSEEENDIEEQQDEFFSGDNGVDLLIEDQLLRHNDLMTSATRRPAATRQGHSTAVTTDLNARTAPRSLALPQPSTSDPSIANHASVGPLSATLQTTSVSPDPMRESVLQPSPQVPATTVAHTATQQPAAPAPPGVSPRKALMEAMHTVPVPPTTVRTDSLGKGAPAGQGTTPASPTLSPEEEDDIRNVIGRCKDTLSTITGPTTQNTYGRNEGAWMKDPLAKDERIYVTNYYYGNTLVEFRNLENFKQGRWSNSYKLPYSWIGTGHVVYNGAFYYNRAFTRNIIKYDLKQRYVAAWAMLHDVAYEEATPWRWQGHSDVDFAVDENGLWLIYPALDDEGFSQEVIVLSKLNAADLSTQKETTWRTGLRRNFYGNCFVICGVLYAVDSYNQRNANISYAFDTHTNTQIVPRLLFENEYSYTTQIDYNPKDRLLYAWDNGHQVTYHVIFAY